MDDTSQINPADPITQILSGAGQNYVSQTGQNIQQNLQTQGQAATNSMQPVVANPMGGVAANPMEGFGDVAMILGGAQSGAGGNTAYDKSDLMQLYKTRADNRVAIAGQMNNMIQAKGETQATLAGKQADVGTTVLADQITLGTKLLDNQMRYAQMGVEQAKNNISLGDQYYPPLTNGRGLLEAKAGIAIQHYREAHGGVAPIGEIAAQIYQDAAAQTKADLMSGKVDPAAKAPVAVGTSGATSITGATPAGQAPEGIDPNQWATMTPQQQVEAAKTAAATKQSQMEAANTEMTAKQGRIQSVNNLAQVDRAKELLDDLDKNGTILSKPGAFAEKRSEIGNIISTFAGNQSTKDQAAKLQELEALLKSINVGNKNTVLGSNARMAEPELNALSAVGGTAGNQPQAIRDFLAKSRNSQLDSSGAYPQQFGGPIQEREIAAAKQRGYGASPLSQPQAGTVFTDPQTGKRYTSINGKFYEAQ